MVSPESPVEQPLLENDVPAPVRRNVASALLETENSLAVGVGIVRLGEIEVAAGTFEASFMLRLAYIEPGLKDRGVLDSGDRYSSDASQPSSGWPNWIEDCPNRPLINERAFANAHEIESSGVASVKLVHKLDGLAIRGLVRMSVMVRGTFYENMELEDFPYDVQHLSIHLRSTISGRDFKLLPLESETNFKFEFQCPDWHIYCPPLAEMRNEGDKLGHCEFVVNSVVRRKPAFYENNFVVMLCVITTIAFSGFFCPLQQDLSQNLQNTLTLMLTAAYFRFSMEDKLPAVNYMTILDKYILCNFAFMITIVAVSLFSAVCMMQWVTMWVKACVFGGWVCFNFLFVLRRMRFQRQVDVALAQQGLTLMAETEEDEPIVNWKIL